MNANGTSVSGPVFQGRYVQDIEAVLVASLVSRQNAMFFSPPGWGKTDILKAAAEYVYGDEYTMIQFEPSTDSDKVNGKEDLGALMVPPYKYIIDTTNTLYDPRSRVMILDELHRQSDAAADATLVGLNHIYYEPHETGPVCWGTSNFINKSDRVAAMVDRFPLNMWFKPDPVDIESFCQNYLGSGRLGQKPHLQNGMPSREKIQWAREVVLGPNAIKAVTQFMADLWDKAEQGLQDGNTVIRSFAHTLNNRRRVQWINIVSAYSAFLTESDDFMRVPNAVGNVMAYANVFTSYDEASDWAKLIGEAIDPVQAAIQQAAVETYSKLRFVQDQEKQGALAHLDAVMEVTRIMSEGVMKIQIVARENNIPDNDEGMNTQIKYIQDTVSAFGRGEDI